MYPSRSDNRRPAYRPQEYRHPSRLYVIEFHGYEPRAHGRPLAAGTGFDARAKFRMLQARIGKGRRNAPIHRNWNPPQ